jgi:hypothetical protein
MSAFLVNDRHIDALLTWAMRPRWQAPAYYRFGDKQVTFFDNLDDIGQCLVNQNYASLNGRYGDTDPAHEYKFKRYDTSLLDPVRVIKACDCYNYQACETGESYWKSEAHEIIDTIRERAIDALPGYDEAAWEIR